MISEEVPSNFYYPIFFCEEYFEGDPLPPPSKNAKIYGEMNEVALPGTLNEFLTKLVASTDCDYTVSLRAHGWEDICSVITQSHFHLLFYVKSFIGAGNFFKTLLPWRAGTKKDSKTVRLCCAVLQIQKSVWRWKYRHQRAPSDCVATGWKTLRLLDQLPT